MCPIDAGRGLLFAVLFGLSLPATASFITDRVSVPLRSTPDGEVLKTLTSGEQVDVLLRAGQHARVRTRDGQIGWVPDAMLSEERPLSLEYLDLRSRYKALEQQLAEAEKRLAEPPPKPAGALIDEQALAELRQQAKDGRWMKVEMEKARARADKLQEELGALRKRTSAEVAEASGSRQTLQTEVEKLRAEKTELETRLAAALLLAEEAKTAAAAALVESAADASAPSVSLPVFVGGLLVALLAGGMVGVRWLDRRIRARHGGFRLY